MYLIFLCWAPLERFMGMVCFSSAGDTWAQLHFPNIVKGANRKTPIRGNVCDSDAQTHHSFLVRNNK